MENFIEIIKSEKQQYLPHFLSGYGFKVYVINRALPFLHEGLLEIMLTVFLSPMFCVMMCVDKWLNWFFDFSVTIDKINVEELRPT